MQVSASSVVMTAAHQYDRAQSLRPASPSLSPNSSSNSSSRSSDRRQDLGAASGVADAQVPDHVRLSVRPFQGEIEDILDSSASAEVITSEITDPKLRLMKMVIEAYTGRSISSEYNLTQKGDAETEAAEVSLENAQAIDESQRHSGEGVVLSDMPPMHFSLREKEISVFEINANVTLANGKQVTVHLEERMERSLRIEKVVSGAEARKLMDPLVLNFSGPVQLDDERVSFDLNADGSTEQIASFASNSAYLALDKNGDGVINDGSELFGALTGNGFAELALYDDDGNGFIDSGDAVFSQLQLFRPEFADRSQSIQQAGVEALYLGNTATPFSLTSNSGEQLGVVRSSGFFVTEDGDAHSLQQIDLVV